MRLRPGFSSRLNLSFIVYPIAIFVIFAFLLSLAGVQVAGSKNSAMPSEVGPSSSSPSASTGTGTWLWQHPTPQGNTLKSLSCPSDSVCYAVGTVGTIIKTVDSASTWNVQPSEISANLNAISCTDINTCYAVGDGGIILKTSDGGTTWLAQNSNTTANLYGLSCRPATGICYAIGAGGTIRAITNGGPNWITQVSNTTNDLNAISCPADNTCYVVGASGTLRKTINSGGQWDTQTSGTSDVITAISCPDINICYAASVKPTYPMTSFLKTIDGGVNWNISTFNPASIDPRITTIFCISASDCYMAGSIGAYAYDVPSAIFFTSDGGTILSKVTNCAFKGLKL